MSRAVAMPSVDLTPDQLRFVESRVRQGRFDSAAAVVTAALHLLERDEAKLDAWRASLEVARRRGDQEGWVELDDALAVMDAAIDEVEAEQTKDA